MANSTTILNAMGTTTARGMRCSITLGSVPENDYEQWLEPSTLGVDNTLSGTRHFDVTGGVPVTMRLICETSAGGRFVAEDTVLTATFVPTN